MTTNTKNPEYQNEYQNDVHKLAAGFLFLMANSGFINMNKEVATFGEKYLPSSKYGPTMLEMLIPSMERLFGDVLSLSAKMHIAADTADKKLN